MSRLEAMGISSFREMLMPFKDLSLGQQDCVKMAKTLGHGAVFDEFGSTLGPLDIYKLCKGLRRFVRDYGLGNVTIATCNTAVASYLKPDWIISTALGSDKINFKAYDEGHWGSDRKHRVEGAMDAISSRLLRSNTGNWSQEEVCNLIAEYDKWEHEKGARGESSCGWTGVGQEERGASHSPKNPAGSDMMSVDRRIDTEGLGARKGKGPNGKPFVDRNMLRDRELEAQPHLTSLRIKIEPADRGEQSSQKDHIR